MNQEFTRTRALSGGSENELGVTEGCGVLTSENSGEKQYRQPLFSCLVSSLIPSFHQLSIFSWLESCLEIIINFKLQIEMNCNLNCIYKDLEKIVLMLFHGYLLISLYQNPLHPYNVCLSFS